VCINHVRSPLEKVYAKVEKLVEGLKSPKDETLNVLQYPPRARKR
jgi:hypothetical protein